MGSSLYCKLSGNDQTQFPNALWLMYKGALSACGQTTLPTNQPQTTTKGGNQKELTRGMKAKKETLKG